MYPSLLTILTSPETARSLLLLNTSPLLPVSSILLSPLPKKTALGESRRVTPSSLKKSADLALSSHSIFPATALVKWTPSIFRSGIILGRLKDAPLLPIHRYKNPATVIETRNMRDITRYLNILNSGVDIQKLYQTILLK